MKKMFAAIFLAGVLSVLSACGAMAAQVEILSESETEAEQVSGQASEQDAVAGARTLYSQMKHYSELTDNDRFAECFDQSVDAAILQNELQAIQAADEATKDLDRHLDLCYFDPSSDKTQSSPYFGACLTDYKVNDDGTVEWYSTLLRVASYDGEWKASPMPEDNLLSGHYPEAFVNAQKEGRNAIDIYPYFALRFADDAVFDGALYSLVNMVWQNGDGSVSAALWVANGLEAAKWCDSMDLILKDGSKTIASVNVPVQQALEPGESVLCTVDVPLEDVKTGTDKWADLTVQSNLLYQ